VAQSARTRRKAITGTGAALTQVRVGYPASINGRDVRVVQGRTAAGTLVTMYFDPPDRFARPPQRR